MLTRHSVNDIGVFVLFCVLFSLIFLVCLALFQDTINSKTVMKEKHEKRLKIKDYTEDEKTISGSIKNTTPETIRHLQVSAVFYNADGIETRESDEVWNLEKGKEFKFKVKKNKYVRLEFLIYENFEEI